jgi:hypothetical protein
MSVNDGSWACGHVVWVITGRGRRGFSPIMIIGVVLGVCGFSPNAVSAWKRSHASSHSLDIP